MLVNVDAKRKKGWENSLLPFYTHSYICSSCGKEETVISKHKTKTRKSNLCKQCRNKSYYTKDPTKRQRWLLQKRYGISLEEYQSMYEQQGECCAICKKHSSMFSKNLCVDHDHTTGEVRALLCVDCNRNVGVYENYGTVIQQYLTLFKKGGRSKC